MIAFKNVTKRFGTKTVIDNLSFSTKKGEILFVIGRSGTGKSVLLKHIVGLLKPDEGQVWVDETEVSGLSEKDMMPIRKRCGLVFQSPALLDSLTIYENLAFGLRAHKIEKSETAIRDRIQKTLARVNLSADILDKLPSELSFGMQKRVGLARTLVLDPEVLLYDEPTTGLDPVTTTLINNLTAKISRELQVTSIVVSHDMHCATRIADRIIMLDKGRIVAEGTVQQMMRSQSPMVAEFMREAKERGGV